MEVSYILLCFTIAGIAVIQNRSGFWWFIIALVFTPLIMGIILLVIGKYVAPTDDPVVDPVVRRTGKIWSKL